MYNAETGEPLPGVVVSFGDKTLAVTDERGDFILLYKELIEVDALQFTTLGYDTLSITKSDWNEVLMVEMEPVVCALAKDTRRTVSVTAGLVGIDVKQSTLPERLWWKIRKMVNSH